jgi:CheY-like chemotaxis protein
MTAESGSTVLLVEDNETIRDAFAILLGESGYNVISAATGQEALDLARSDRPDLVLMDLGLPDMNGLEVTRRIKGDAKTKGIVVVALTGRALETDRAECLAAGCAGYLPKPIDTRRLLDALPRYLAGETDLTSS